MMTSLITRFETHIRAWFFGMPCRPKRKRFYHFKLTVNDWPNRSLQSKESHRCCPACLSLDSRWTRSIEKCLSLVDRWASARLVLSMQKKRICQNKNANGWKTLSITISKKNQNWNSPSLESGRDLRSTCPSLGHASAVINSIPVSSSFYRMTNSRCRSFGC